MSDARRRAACEQTQDPQVVSNPPGLATIAYRVDDFAGFRRALLRRLPGEQALARLAARRPATSACSCSSGGPTSPTC